MTPIEKDIVLRNRLVHQYDDLDDALVYQAIDRTLRLFPRYLRAVVAYLDAQQ